MDETEFNCLGSLHFTPEEINLIFKEHSSDVVIHQSQFFHFMTEAMKNSGDAAELILTKITLFIHQYHHKLTTKEIEDLVATLNETNFDLFWQFLIELLNQHGIAVFEQPHNLISSIIDSNLIQFPGTFQIIFIKTFFLCFFIENRVIEIGNSTDNFLFVKMDDDAFNLVFNALMKCNTVEKSEILIDFIMTLIHKNTFEFDFLNQYFIQGILRFIGQNNVSWIILQLLVKFIDAIEGRVDLTRFGREIFQIPRKYQTIRIYFPNKDSIDLNIKVKNTSLSALRNIISSITHSPLDSICFNVNSLENTKTICFELKNINTHLHSASFENFPSVFISNSDIYGFIMLNIQNDQAGPFCLKLLHRLKKAPSDFLQDSPEYFAEVLYKDDLSPYLYQYFTEHLEHLLQHRESENGNIGNYEIIIQILFNLLISLKFPMKNQKTCLRILRKYFNTSLSEESVVSLLAVFCEEPCNEDLLLFISKYLPENGINLNDISIARNLIMNTTNVIFNAIKNIFLNINNVDILTQLILDMIYNTNNYLDKAIYIEAIVKIILVQFNGIIDSIISPAIEKCKFSISNELVIICDILSEIYEIRTFDSIEVLSHLFSIALKTNNIDLQKSIFRFLRKIPDTDHHQLKILISILAREFNLFAFDPQNYTPPVQHFSGLTNLGCTCYMNSVLQQLSSTNDVLASLICNIDALNDFSLRDDVQQLKLLLFTMRFGDNTVIDMTEYCKAFSSYFPNFNPLIQEDASEFFISLLSSLPQSVNDIFTCKQKNSIRNANFEILGTKIEEFTAIDLTINDHFDIHSSLNNYTNEKLLTGENQYVTDSGVKIDAFSKVQFEYIPNHLVFHLNRFSYSPIHQERYKINSFFEFPMKLNMDEYKEGAGLYELTGVVLHSGVVQGGHYQSIIQNKDQNCWILIDDTEISQISEDLVMEMSFGSHDSNDRQNTTNAYMLFYTKIIE